jgi:hypothetical protein
MRVVLAVVLDRMESRRPHGIPTAMRFNPGLRRGDL